MIFPIRINSLLIFLFCLVCSQLYSQRQMEHLDRGVIAIKTNDNQIYIGWRLLATDPENIGFDVYRNDQKINNSPIFQSTNFIDSKCTESSEYVIKSILNGKKLESSKPVKLWIQAYHSIPLQTPEGCRPNDASVGDLDGDGQYELVLHQSPRGRDNSRKGFTEPPILQAYELDGTLLWEINLGINIREGAHHSNRRP
jgi:rhamnogalacturonan endolyase